MLHFTATQWLLCVLVALSIGLAKAGFNGVGMLGIILMAQILPARESTGAILPMLITADIVAVKAYHRHSNFPLVLRLLPAAVVGIVCGWLLMPCIPAEGFGRVIGWLTLAFLALAVMQRIRPGLVGAAAEHPRFALPFGWLAGVTTMLANAAGPITTIYLLSCRLPKMAFVGTAAWFFFVINVIKVPFSASLGLINLSSLTLNGILAPVVIGGVLFGKVLLGKINQAAFEWLMIGLSFLGAVKLVVG